MKYFIIHAGLAKCGSTSIQHFLKNNKSLLYDINYSYIEKFPSSIIKINNTEFERSKLTNFLTNNSMSFNELHEDLEKILETDKNILISDEYIIFNSKENLLILQDYLNKKKYILKIIIIYRNIFDQIFSAYKQMFSYAKKNNVIPNLNIIKKKLLKRQSILVYDSINTILKNKIIFINYDKYKKNLVNKFSEHINLLNIKSINQDIKKNRSFTILECYLQKKICKAFGYKMAFHLRDVVKKVDHSQSNIPLHYIKKDKSFFNINDKTLSNKIYNFNEKIYPSKEFIFKKIKLLNQFFSFFKIKIKKYDDLSELSSLCKDDFDFRVLNIFQIICSKIYSPKIEQMFLWNKLKFLNTIEKRETFVIRFFERNDIPKNLIIIGVGEKSEYLSIKKILPNINIHGTEPNSEVVNKISNKFPGKIFNYAIGTRNSHRKLYKFENSLMNSFYRTSRDYEIVNSISLDDFDKILGHPKDILLWIDAEGSELEILKSGLILLKSKRVKYLNIEVRNIDDNKNWPKEYIIDKFLKKFNFSKQLNYNFHHTHSDAIYKLF